MGLYAFYFTVSLSCLITVAGLPATTTWSGTSFVITDPDPITTLSPIVTPGLIIAPPPIQALSPMVTGFPYSFPDVRSTGSSGCEAVYICTPGANIQLSPTLISHTSKKTQLKLA